MNDIYLEYTTDDPMLQMSRIQKNKQPDMQVSPYRKGKITNQIILFFLGSSTILSLLVKK